MVTGWVMDKKILLQFSLAKEQVDRIEKGPNIGNDDGNDANDRDNDGEGSDVEQEVEE